MLNPVYKLDYIPERSPYALLVLPADKTVYYLQKEISVQGVSVKPADYNDMVAQSGNTKGRTRIIHVVQPGEFTHKIAMQYHVTLENIKAWNHLDGNEVKVGQLLVIWVAGDE